MKTTFRVLAGLALLAFAAASLPASAQTPGKSILFSSKQGDLTFPFTPPTASAAGTIDNMVVGSGTPRGGSFTTLSATSTVSGAGMAARFASPGPIGSTSPSTGAFTAVTSAYVTATTFFNASTANTLTAVGTTRADALALTKAINVVTTAAAGTGVVLPSAANVGEGGTVIVFNQDATNAIKVYAAGSDTIDGTAGATGVTLTATKRCAYTVVGGVFISAQLGAVSG